MRSTLGISMSTSHYIICTYIFLPSYTVHHYTSIVYTPFYSIKWISLYHICTHLSCLLEICFIILFFYFPASLYLNLNLHSTCLHHSYQHYHPHPCLPVCASLLPVCLPFYLLNHLLLPTRLSSLPPYLFIDLPINMSTSRFHANSHIRLSVYLSRVSFLGSVAESTRRCATFFVLIA